MCFFFFSSRRRHTRCYRDWSSDVCSSDLPWPVNCAGAGVPTNIWAKAFGAVQLDPATTNAKTDADRRPIRDIVHSLKLWDNGTHCEQSGRLAREIIAPNDPALHGKYNTHVMA